MAIQTVSREKRRLRRNPDFQPADCLASGFAVVRPKPVPPASPQLLPNIGSSGDKMNMGREFQYNSPRRVTFIVPTFAHR